MEHIINPCVRKPILRVIVFGIIVAVIFDFINRELLSRFGLKAPEEMLWYWGVLIVFLIILAWVISRFKYLKIEPEYILMRKGILGVKETRIVYSRVTHCSFEQNIIDRLLNICTLHINTAGTNSVEMLFPDIEKDDAKEIIDLVEKKTMGTKPDGDL